MISAKDNSYWNNFYSTNKLINKPSSFAIEIVKFLDKNSSLLELGCGNGRDSFFFAKHDINVIALDLSKKAIENNNTLNDNENLNFLIRDFTNLEPNEFDKLGNIYSRFTLHSIDKPDYLRTIDWVGDNLKEGGLFFIEARTINDPLFGIGEKVANDGYINTHYRRFFRIKEVMTDLESRGLKLVHVSENFLDSWYKDDHAVVMRIICEKR